MHQNLHVAGFRGTLQHLLCANAHLYVSFCTKDLGDNKDVLIHTLESAVKLKKERGVHAHLAEQSAARAAHVGHAQH